jgi:hypothetical protein
MTKVFDYRTNPTSAFRSGNKDELEDLLNKGWTIVNSIPLGLKDGSFYATLILDNGDN